MEERVINILLDIKADIGGVRKRLDQVEINLEQKIDRLDGRVGNLETDMAELKSTVNSLSDALLDTSRQVKQMKAKG